MEANLKIGVFSNLVEEEIEHGVGLGFGHTNNAPGEAWVNIDALEACDGMYAHDRMDGFNWFTADG